jgi:hypothetical protein
MNGNAFRSEAQLARSSRRVIRAALAELEGSIRTRNEVAAPGSVPDLVIFAGCRSDVRYVVSVEFKLRDWRRALRQAFRHRNCVNEAYVVIDHARSASAIQHLDVFERANVGLATIDCSGEIRCYHFPEPSLPFSVAFAHSLAKSLLAPRKTIPSDMPFTRTTRGGAALAGLRNMWATHNLPPLPVK